MHSHQGDEQLFGILNQMGVDMAKPRELNFYFGFPNEAAADSAMKVLTTRKFQSEKSVNQPPFWKRLFVKPDWTVSASREMALDKETVKKITTLFQQIANKYEGNYDGWEANVMGDNLNV